MELSRWDEIDDRESWPALCGCDYPYSTERAKTTKDRLQVSVLESFFLVPEKGTGCMGRDNKGAGGNQPASQVGLDWTGLDWAGGGGGLNEFNVFVGHCMSCQC